MTNELHAVIRIPSTRWPIWSDSWVGLTLFCDIPPTCHLLIQLYKFPISPRRTRENVEMPSYPTRLATLYLSVKSIIQLSSNHLPKNLKVGVNRYFVFQGGVPRSPASRCGSTPSPSSTSPSATSASRPTTPRPSARPQISATGSGDSSLTSR